MTREEQIELLEELEELDRLEANKSLLAFSRYTQNDFQAAQMHMIYYEILDRFAKGKIKKLRVSMPAQHGKTEGSTRKLPSFIVGLNPNTKVGIGAYNDDLAKSFNRDIKKIIKSTEYKNVFPRTILPKHAEGKEGVEQANYFDVGESGFIKTVGRGGALTGTPIDIMIMDDLYKDKTEAYSPIYRKRVWEWYTSVVRTRYHNNTRELMVFTRWHENDLMGMLDDIEKVVYPKTWEDIDNADEDAWIHINFPAIKVDEPFELDPRKEGEALWSQKHNLHKLEGQKNLNPVEFECMMQGNPASQEGLLYPETFKTYREDGTEKIKNTYYCDVADKGKDYFCAILFDYMVDRTVRVRDIVYTDKDQDTTIGLMANAIIRQDAKSGLIESNAGGHGFIRAVLVELKDKNYQHKIIPLHQTNNKESRILSYAPLVVQNIYFPQDYKTRFPEFAMHIHRFKEDFGANDHDDAADTLTGVYEMMYGVIKIKK